MAHISPRPRFGTRRIRVLGLLVGVTIALFCSCAFIAVIGLSQVLPRLDDAIKEFASSSKGAEFVGELFLVMLEDEDWRRAYMMCTPELQEKYGSATGLGKHIKENNLRPILHSWKFTTLDSSTFNQFKAIGEITFSDNHPGTIELTLVKNNGGWKISAFTLTRLSR